MVVVELGPSAQPTDREETTAREHVVGSIAIVVVARSLQVNLSAGAYELEEVLGLDLTYTAFPSRHNLPQSNPCAVNHCGRLKHTGRIILPHTGGVNLQRLDAAVCKVVHIRYHSVPVCARFGRVGGVRSIVAGKVPARGTKLEQSS